MKIAPIGPAPRRGGIGPRDSHCPRWGSPVSVNGSVVAPGRLAAAPLRTEKGFRVRAMSPNHVASRLLASAPVLVAVVVAAGLAGAGWGDLAGVLPGAAVTGVVLVSALIPGLAIGAWAGARVGVGGAPSWLDFAVRVAAAARGTPIVALIAPILAAVVVAIGGRDAAVVWFAELAAAVLAAARSSALALETGEGRDGVVAALGRGVAPGTIVRRHAFPLAFTRTVAEMGPTTAALTAGSAVVETVTGLPGVGQACARAAMSGNAPAFAAAVAALFAVAMVIDAAGAGFVAGRASGRR